MLTQVSRRDFIKSGLTFSLIGWSKLRLVDDEVLADKVYEYILGEYYYIEPERMNMDEGEAIAQLPELYLLELGQCRTRKPWGQPFYCPSFVPNLNIQALNYIPIFSTTLEHKFYPEKFPISKMINIRNIIIKKYLSGQYHWENNTELGYYRNKGTIR